MAISMNRPVVGAQRPLVRPASSFASKSALSKVAEGWKETISEMPSDAVSLVKRAGHAIAHPIDAIEHEWESIKANPKKALVPIAMMAGGAALSAISPGLMRYVGLAMTGSMFVFPTIRFAKSDTEAELHQVADATSKQLVNYAASYAATWAAGKAIRYSLDKIKGAKAEVGAKSVQARGGEEAGAGEKIPSRQLKGDTPEEMMKVGRGDTLNPDEINYRYIRNNKELGHQFVTDVRGKVKDFYLKQLAQQNPKASPADLEAFLNTAEARPIRLQMVQDVRGIVHANYLAYHGVQVPENMAITDMVGTRKYLQNFSSSYDLADAVKGINAGVAKGVTNASKLGVEAERFLYAERGVAQPSFARFEKAGMTAEELKKVRLFADSFANGAQGKYLKVAANVASQDVDAVRGAMTRQMLSDVGFILPKDVDNRTLTSFVRDLASEDPRNIKSIVGSVNEALKQGKRNYYEINEFANRKILKDLGVSETALKKLDLPEEALKAAQPSYPVELTRAEQVRLLRDRLRVLPEADRQAALVALEKGKANLLNFDSVLAPHLDARLAQVTGADAKLVAQMTKDMTIQQKTNFLTDVSHLPEDVRAQAFAGLKGTPEQMNKAVVDRLAGLVEKNFEVNVHREAGKYPMPYEWAREDDPFVRDWSVQGVSQLYNGLAKMGRNGTLPAPIKGTTYVNMNGSAPSQGLVPFTLGHPKSKPLLYYRPGSDAYQGGVMGYRTSLGEGKDMIVMFDAAMKMPNSDEAAGITMAEGTVIHETGHAFQLGGPKGATQAQQIASDQTLVKEWSALSDWRERDGSLADGYHMLDGQPRNYYKDSSVQVGKRSLVVSDYGATDPVEDFAEFTRVFYNDPGAAMQISPEKYLYLNQLYGNPYSPSETTALANALGLGQKGLTAALDRMRQTIKLPASTQPSVLSRIAGAVLGRKAA